MITRTESNCTNTYSQYRLFQSRYLVEMMNILLSWYSSKIPLWTHNTHTHTHCVVPPAYVYLCNPYIAPLYRKSSNLSKQLFDITLHNKNTFFPLHTHTHTHTHM